MKYTIILFLTMMTIISCKDKKYSNTETSATKTEASAADPAKDSADIRFVIIDFYTWYDKNYRQMMKYQLYSGINKKDEAPYRLNRDEVNRYLAFIRDSVSQLGDAFLDNHERLFTKIDSAFKVDVEGDVPYYFDFDWFTNSQEGADYLLDGIKKSTKWIINVKDNDATVEIGAPEDKNYVPGSLLLQLNMKKENGLWTIAKIGND